MTTAPTPAELAPKSKRFVCPDVPTKATYTTLERAEAGARRASERFKTTVVPYICAVCGHYHLTSNMHKSDVVRRRDDGTLETNATWLREQLNSEHDWRPLYMPPHWDKPLTQVMDELALQGYEVRIEVRKVRPVAIDSTEPAVRVAQSNHVD